MLTDPWMDWQDGVFPYEALREAGIGPDSSMQQVHDAYFELMERGLASQERRLAWDQLRKTERRLWVDFLQYPLSREDIAGALAELRGALADPAPVEPDYGALGRMERDFHPFDLQEVVLEPLPDFEPADDPAAALDFESQEEA